MNNCAIPMHELSMKLFFDGLSQAAENVYIFISDLNKGVSVWSDNAVEYFGLPEGYENNTSEIWIQRVHPDDRNAYVEDINEVFQGKKTKTYI